MDTTLALRPGAEIHAPGAERPKLGRPSIYTQALADRFCLAVAGGRTLREVCRDEWAPDHDTIYEWRKNRPEFADALAHARESCADHLAESCLALVDGVDPDAPTGAARVSKAREQVGVRRWLASCMNPRWGERVQLDMRAVVGVAFARMVRPTDGDSE